MFFAVLMQFAALFGGGAALGQAGLPRVVDVMGWSAKRGIATRFAAHHDAANSQPFAACLGRRLDDAHDAIVAHPTLPCRSPVVVCLVRTGACAPAIVGDRGPRHALVDLSPQVAAALGYGAAGGFNGREKVVLFAPRVPGSAPRASTRKRPGS